MGEFIKIMLHKVKKGLHYKRHLQKVYDDLQFNDDRVYPGAKIEYHAQPSFHPLK